MNFQILFLVAAMLGMGTLFSLLAMLVGWLRWHWLIQALILVGSTAPFALIGAEDLLIVALCQGFIVLGFIRFQQSWLKMVERQNELNEVGTRRRTTIGLKEIMFGIVLVCALIATITQTLENGALHIEDFYKSAHPFRLVGIGLAFGIWNLAFVTFFRQGVSKKAKIRFSITILLLLVWAGWNDEAVLHRIKMIWYYSNASNPALTIPTKLTGLRSLVPWLILLVAGSLVTWLIAGGFRSFVYRTPRQYQNWIARLKKPAISILALAALGSMILAVITCYRSVAPTKTTSSQIYAQGAPNGFATLVEAGKQFDQSLIFNGIVPELPGPNLKDELITYEKQFTAVRHALSQPNCTWINWNTGECFSGNSSFFDPGGVELRSIARALRARNLQLLHEKRYAEAMADGVLGTRVGETLSRDPVFISTLIGTAIEGMSVDLIFSGVKKASSIQLKKIANQLDEIYSHAGSSDSEMDRILDNEKIFNRRAGWQASLILHL